MAGAIIDWLNNNLQVFDNFSELEDILKIHLFNSEVVMVPAFYWFRCTTLETK